MRILFTNTGPWGTGSFTSILGIIHQLQKHGHTVKVFFPDTFSQATQNYKFYNNDLYKIWHFPIKNDKAEIKTFPLMITDPHPRSPDFITYKNFTADQTELYYSECSKQLQRVIDEFKPDIIESNHIWAMSYVLHTLGYKYFAVAHHSDQMGFYYDPTIRDKAIIAAQNAEKIFAISEYVKDQVHKLYDVDSDKIIIAENGYDDEIFYPQKIDRKKLLQSFNLKIPDDAKIITFTGKLSKTKGIDILIEANYYLRKKNLNAHFIILGAGELSEIIAELSDKNYSIENMHFIGHQDLHVSADFHNIAKFSVMPSRTEGFGIAGLEAMGCGIPLITTFSGGPESFAVGDIVEPGSPIKLSDSIEKMLSMQQLAYEFLGKKALETAKQYAWSVVIKKRIAAYEQFLKNSHKNS